MSDHTITVYLIRHGLTKQNLAREYQGNLLNYDILPESRDLIIRRRNRGLVPDIRALWVSPLVRARTTASLYFPEMPCQIKPDIAERDFGRWDRHTHDELLSDLSYVEFLEKGGMGTDIPGGECWALYETRLERAIGDMKALALRSPEAFPLALVFHGGPIFYLTHRLIPAGAAFHSFSVKGAGGLKLDIHPDTFLAERVSALFADDPALEETPFYKDFDNPDHCRGKESSPASSCSKELLF